MRINHQPARNLVRNAGAEIPANDMQAEIDACCTSGGGQDLSFVNVKDIRLTWISGYLFASLAAYNQCVVARRLFSRPVAATTNTPEHIETRREPRRERGSAYLPGVPEAARRYAIRNDDGPGLR